jgi:hypothetical protein
MWMTAMTLSPSRSDLIELGRRAEDSYDRAERALASAAPAVPSLATVDAAIGRDVWRRFCELRGGEVRFPADPQMTALGHVVTLSVDRQTRRLDQGDAEAYVAVGAAVWESATGVRVDA